MRLATILLGLLLGAVSCTPRTYWPQGHYHRAALPAAPRGEATLTVVQGWRPAPVKCQQRQFPFYLSRK